MTLHDEPTQAQPGWYHAGGGQLRWWDGRAWTQHVVVAAHPARPPRRATDPRFVIGILLVLCLPLALLLSVFGLMGDPFPISRVGVATDSAGLVVLNAVCPNERLKEITLYRTVAPNSSEVLWSISGDAALPDRLVLGTAPSGMSTHTRLLQPMSASDELSLHVTTSELTTPYAMDFTVADVPATGALSFGDVYPTDDAFRRATVADTPCGDPYSKDRVGRFAVIALSVGVVAAIGGAVLIARSRRRPTPGPPPPLPA